MCFLQSSDTAWLSLLIARVRELSKKKTYLQELCTKVIVDIFEVVSSMILHHLALARFSLLSKNIHKQTWQIEEIQGSASGSERTAGCWTYNLRTPNSNPQGVLCSPSSNPRLCSQVHVLQLTFSFPTSWILNLVHIFRFNQIFVAFYIPEKPHEKRGDM